MAKKSVTIIIILTALFNLFFFLRINNSSAEKLLMDKAVIYFHFHLYTDDRGESKEAFLKKIKDFSAENGVEIAQYSFWSSDKIDIYSTMGDNYREILSLPDFIFNRDIKVHDFEALLDVGFKNVLYVDADDMNLIEDLAELLKDYCEIDYTETGFKNPVLSLDVSFFSIICFYILALVLILFFYYSVSQRTLSVYHLWGYTDVQIYRALNKPFFKAMLLTMVLSNLVMGGILYRSFFFGLRHSGLLPAVFTAMLKLNTAAVFVIFMLSIPLFRVLCTVTDHNRRKRGLTKIMAVSYFSRILLVLLLIFLCEQFFYQNMKLRENLDGLPLWENARNLFNVYESYYLDNLAAEGILDDKVFRIYQELSDLDKVFIMDTLNFERPGTENFAAKDPEDIEYSYKLNVERTEDLYTPHGKNITVDENYLKRHTIRSVDGKDVIDLIDQKDNVLNLLVPLKFKEYENTIEESFKEWFHFHKMEVANIYKEARGQDEIEIDIDDLEINIIYIENSQNLFTYNCYSGDQFNRIEDSIITVYTGNVDPSFLAVCFGRCIFLEADDEYSALKEIRAVSQKYNVTELNKVASVYDQKGEEIRIAEADRNKLILNMILMVLLLAMFMTAIVYACYKAFFPTITIKYLHGHSFRQIYGRLILFNLFVNVFALFLAGIVSKKISFYMIILCVAMSVMDYCLSRIICRCLRVKGEMQFIKGDVSG